MYCSIYRSRRKDYTYLYLARGRPFEDLPERLRKAFGPPEHVMDLDLHPERTLASADVGTVLANLRAQGYHLQLPPGDQRGDLI